MQAWVAITTGVVRPIVRISVFAIALMLVAGASYADTIVLKNGRRIVALSVTQDGDKVRYQTSAGELSLPKSIVDHIETGSVPPPDSLIAATAANLRISPPTIEPGGPIERGAVHDDAIDREYLAK